MAPSKPTPTFTTAIQPPPGPSTPLVLPTHPLAAQNPPIFNDALQVRTRVFIDEQHCSADTEIDTDDARSWQWVIYASPGAKATDRATNNSQHAAAAPSPVAVIRLVPPPQLPHALLTHPSDPANEHLPAYDWTHEPCVKLTRVAVLPEYRGHGLGRRLVETALEWAASHAAEIDAAAVRLAAQTQGDGKGGGGGVPSGWRGLVLVHAQVDVERMYSGLGFVTDEGLGRWDEEGIEHVGMFYRVEVR